MNTTNSAGGSSEQTEIGKIDRDVLLFTVGKDPVLDLELAEWDCFGTAAHVTMLSRMSYSPRIFSVEERNRVVSVLAAIAESARKREFKISDADQDCHLAIERIVTERLGEIGRRIHTGRSRNDQSATAVRLYARNELLGCIGEMAQLASVLTAFGRCHHSIPMVGRTHLQPAMPSSVGVWATCYAEALLDDVTLVKAAYDVTNRCPLGSAAGYGVPLPIDRELTSRLLAFKEPVHNVMYAGNSRGKTESAIVSALCQVMLTLSRLAEDLVLFSMPEFGYFSIPKEFCTGSSIMPQKYNPDVCELIRARAARLIGLSAGTAAIIKAMPGGYNRDLQDTKELLIEAFNATRSSLRIMTRIAGGLMPVPEKLRAAFAEPGVFATDRALELVAGGMPFRDAYHQVRDHLEDLKTMDPDKAAAAKTHTGAPAGLDFDMYDARTEAASGDASKELARITQCLANLMKPVKQTS